MRIQFFQRAGINQGNWVSQNQNPSNRSNQSEQRLTSMRTQVKTGNLLEARETRVTKIGLVLVLYLIGWDGGTSLSGPITEQSKEKPKQSRVSLILNWKLLSLNSEIFLIYVDESSVYKTSTSVSQCFPVSTPLCFLKTSNNLFLLSIFTRSCLRSQQPQKRLRE